jgi:parafibromin
MSGTVALRELRAATMREAELPFFVVDGETRTPVDSIEHATHVQLNADSDTLYDLNVLTNFYNEDKPQSLKAVVYCWLNAKSSIVDYKNKCSDLNIPDFKFLVKTELTTWLSGNSDSCTFIKDESETDQQQPEKATSDVVDPQLTRILNFERESTDHNAALRGSKNIDFGYLVSDAKKFIAQLKRSSSSSSANLPKKPKHSQLKQPIILISPASTALLSLANVKQFFEDGTFVEPSPTSKSASNLVTIHHKSENLIPQAHQIMVVDNVDMFTKPEYWDRVVAIFTTGQAWQFSKYKYSKPEQLFQKYTGFHLGYQGDPTPPTIKSWNVKEIKVDRGEKRFRDKMIVRDFWQDIEKILIAKGYGSQ